MFYPDQRDHISPYALSAFKSSKSTFIKRYFEEEEGYESPAMKRGTKIHSLIEMGAVKAKKKFDVHEEKIEIEVKDGVTMLGYPDSRTEGGDKVEVVDYKTGKTGKWEDKIHGDEKVMATAWLVWKEEGEPEEVTFHIEFIPVQWDDESEEMIPLEDQTEVITKVFKEDTLRKFTKVIEKTIDEVNEFYEKWQESTDQFIDKSLVEKYEMLDQEKREIEKEMDEIKEKLLGQMEIGGLGKFQSENGTFYTREREYYTYPDNMEIKVGDKKLSYREAKDVKKEMKNARKNYKMVAEPDSIKRSLSFRKNKKK